MSTDTLQNNNELCDRTYHLVAEGNKTAYTFKAGSSVPQGSCVGPVLFNLYINDLDRIVTNSQTNLLPFADESKFFRKIQNYTHMFELQDKLNQVSKWCIDNKVSINPAKSYTMSIATRYTKRIETFYFLNGQRIKRVDCHKDLGVSFNDDWKFKTQYKEIHRKSNMFGHFGYQLSRQTGSKLTNMKVFLVYNLPIIDYCCTIWN